MKPVIVRTGMILIAAFAAFAQPAFEVVSIKPTSSGAAERSLTRHTGARLSASNATLKMLILMAYQVMPYQLSGGPAWVSSDGFDIEAKAGDPDASPGQFRQMIQRFLADRFQLKYRLETREAAVYSLVASKGGVKLVEACDDGSDVSMRIDGRGHMTGVKATLPMLATTLTRVLQRKVIDQTGLTGAYNFTLQFLPDQNPPDSDAPSIFAALQEQLGLTLKASKGPVEMFIVDSAARPSAN